MNDPKWDSPNWSYFHGCRIHRGEIPPCSKCLAEGHPDVRKIEAETPEDGDPDGTSGDDTDHYALVPYEL